MTASPDSSTRFVLPDDAPLLANLASLWAADPSLAADIEGLWQQESYPTEPSKSGQPTVSVIAPTGRPIYLHSRHQPIDEANRLIATLDDAASKAVFYIHGLGLGYHLDALADAVSSEAIFCVFEPDLLLIRTAMEQRDFSNLLDAGRLLWFTKLNKAELFNRLVPHTAMTSIGTASVDHAPSLQLQPKFHEQMKTWIAEFAAYSRTNINTLILNGRRTAENITRNLGWYVATPDVDRLKDKHKSKPAIVVSAGPSLRKNKHLLKDVQDKAVIVAVQTSLKPLLEMGVEPHFVTSLDYHDICTRFFENLPPNLRTELVAEPKATNKIFDLHPGPLTLIGNEFASGLLRDHAEKKSGLPCGATVAHLAYYLAEHLGCDPIIFIGQDLGFSDGLCYSPGTSYENVWRPELDRFCTLEMKQWEQVVRDRPILRKISDHLGRPMYTEERLFSYLQQFERDFAKSDRRIIDATEGGAAKRGAESMTLADAIARYCTQPIDFGESDHPGVKRDRLPVATAALASRKAEAVEIARIAEQTLVLLEEIHECIDDQPQVNRLIARIDSLRSRMNELGPCYDLISQMTQTTELQRFRADRQIIGARNLDARARQKQQLDRDINNVRNMLSAAKEFQDLMDDVIEQLSTSIGSATEATP